MVDTHDHEDGSSSQTQIFDCSRNEIYGKYDNTGQHAGVINNNGTTMLTTNYQSTSPSPLGMSALSSYINEFKE